jgi:hypothetical protein
MLNGKCYSLFLNGKIILIFLFDFSYLNLNLMFEGDTSSLKKGVDSNDYHEEYKGEKEPFTFVVDGRHLKGGRSSIKLCVNDGLAVPDMKRFVIRVTTSNIENQDKNCNRVFPGIMDVYTRPFLCKKYIGPSRRISSQQKSVEIFEDRVEELVDIGGKHERNQNEDQEEHFDKRSRSVEGHLSLEEEEEQDHNEERANKRRKRHFTDIHLKRLKLKAKEREIRKAKQRDEAQKLMLEQANVVYDLLAFKASSISKNRDITKDGKKKERNEKCLKVVSSEHDQTMRVVNGEVSIHLVNEWLSQSCSGNVGGDTTSNMTTYNQSETINIFILKPEGSSKTSGRTRMMDPTIDDVVCFLPPHGMEDEKYDTKKRGIQYVAPATNGMTSVVVISSLPSASSSLYEVLGNHIIYPNPIQIKKNNHGEKDQLISSHHFNNVPRRWLPAHRNEPCYNNKTANIVGSLKKSFTVYATNRCECLLELRKVCLSEYLKKKHQELPSTAALKGDKASSLQPPSLTTTSIDEFLNLVPNEKSGKSETDKKNNKSFFLHTALRQLPPAIRDFNDHTFNQTDIAAQEYYYLLHDSNPGSLLTYDSNHPKTVCSTSNTGPIQRDQIYLLKKFISPAATQQKSSSLNLNDATIRMEWDDCNAKMLELPIGNPIVLIKIFFAKAYDKEGNVLCRYEMRAIKKLARLDNGTLVWPLKVASDKTLVELQKY